MIAISCVKDLPKWEYQCVYQCVHNWEWTSMSYVSRLFKAIVQPLFFNAHRPRRTIVHFSSLYKNTHHTGNELLYLLLVPTMYLLIQLVLRRHTELIHYDFIKKNLIKIEMLLCGLGFLIPGPCTNSDWLCDWLVSYFYLRNFHNPHHSYATLRIGWLQIYILCMCRIMSDNIF